MAVGSGLGLDSFFRIKQESTYGVSPASGYWTIPILSESIQLILEEFESQSITGSPAADSNQAGPRHVEGALNFQASYNLMDHLLYGVMGTRTISTPATGTNTRDSWFELNTSQPSFCVELNRGDVEHDNDVHPYIGMMVSSLELTIPDRGFITGVASFVGKDDYYVSNAAFGTGVPPDAVIAGDPFTPQYILSHGPNGTTFVVDPAPDTGAYCLRGMTLKIDRKLAPSYCVGQNTPNQPGPDSLVEVSGAFQIELKDENIYDAYAQFQEKTGNTFTWVGAITEAALRYTLQIKLNRLRYLAPSSAFIDRRGKLIVNAPFKCFGNGGTAATTSPGSTSTKEPLAIRTRNLVAALAL